MTTASDDFEKYFEEYKKSPSKDCYSELLHCWKAATKAALVSRVVLPERKEEIELRPDMIFLERAKAWSNEGFNDCLDQIKLIPLTAEQVDSLLPSDEKAYQQLRKIMNETQGNNEFYIMKLMSFIRESIKKRLGGK
jgi:hypothetical protein